MKKLVRIRLINWHYFANEVINVKGNVLLSGPNASGKSTIMDAISYVITAGDTSFNVAANEKGKRDIKGYVKCKLGLDDKEYHRDGDVTGHIALEFFDEKTEKYFTVGVVIDVTSDLSAPKTSFYKADDRFNDDWFVEGKVIRNTVEFRKYNSSFEYFLTKKEAKRAFRNAFGSINEDFFKLIPKALAFKPISDVKEFIYQNILEEKEIDVAAIKDTIRSYKELENTLNLIKDKIQDLNDINLVYQEILKFDAIKEYATYISKLFEQRQTQDDILSLEDNLQKERQKVVSINQNILKVKEDLETYNNQKDEIRDLLKSDENFKALENLKKEINNVENLIVSKESKNKEFISLISDFKDSIQILKKTTNYKIYSDISEVSLLNLNQNNIENTRNKFRMFKRVLSDRINEQNQQLGTYNLEKKDIIDKLGNLKESLAVIEQNKTDFPRPLVSLREDLELGLQRIYNENIKVHIFAELIEITSKEWADIVEVYLGNRRFHFIVAPEYYDSALTLFARIKNQYPMQGIGIVNTKKIKEFTTFDQYSLASIVETENIDARNYANLLMGNVIMCKNELELENYSRAVTRDYLLYSNYTVTTLNHLIKKPLCGKNAFLLQKENILKESQDYLNKHAILNNEIENLTTEINLLNQVNIDSLLHGLENAIELQSLQSKLENLMLTYKKVEKNDSNELNNEYKAIIDLIDQNKAEEAKLYTSLGSTETNIKTIEDGIKNKKTKLIEFDDEINMLLSDKVVEKEQAKEEFNKFIKENSSLKNAYQSFTVKYAFDSHTYENVLENLRNKQNKYIQKYDSSYSVGVSDMPLYLEELSKLEKSELVKYEQKVRTAREEAELIFKEDFIAKLRANIESAEQEIAKINETLKDIKFGQDRYEFIFPKSTEYSQFYDMVTSDLAENATGLFTSNFEDKYRMQIKELFESLSVDETNSHGAINKFTDYRTYMDYDIRITNANNETMSYSKVFKEKSGGETQVPFYVAIIASFVRIYTKNQNYNDSIGIVMFDEVFDKMDSNRMKAMMEFIISMPLQIILACPPQRMSILQEYADSLAIVARSGKTSKVIDADLRKE